RLLVMHWSGVATAERSDPHGHNNNCTRVGARGPARGTAQAARTVRAQARGPHRPEHHVCVPPLLVDLDVAQAKLRGAALAAGLVSSPDCLELVSAGHALRALWRVCQEYLDLLFYHGDRDGPVQQYGSLWICPY